MGNQARTKILIKQNEGEVLKPYQDTRSNLTAGVGINLQDPVMGKLVPAAVRNGERSLTLQESNDSFNKAFDIASKDASVFVGPSVFEGLHPVAQQVVTDMSYNMGYPKLSEFKKFKAALQKGDYIEAARQIKESKYFRDKDTHDRALRNMETLLSIGTGK